MAKKYFFLLLILLCTVTVVVEAQEQSPDYQLRGKLLDVENQISIPFAHITNLNKGVGVLSDSSGFFSIPAREGDSLRVSSVSYGQQIIVAPAQHKQGSYLQVQLAPNVYELKEVVITRFPSERELKQRLLTMDIPKEDKPDMRISESVRHMPVNPDGNARIGLGSPVSAIASKFSKKERGRAFAAEIEAKEERKAIIQTKFNREIVKQITGLEDEEELDKFMQYCVLTEDFLYESNEYEIHKAVLGCFSDFKKEQKG